MEFFFWQASLPWSSLILYLEKGRNKFRKQFLKIKKRSHPLSVKWETLLDASIMNGFETLTRMGGHILLFSVVLPLSAFSENRISRRLPDSWHTGAYHRTSFLALSSLLLEFIRYLCSMCMTAFGGICILSPDKKSSSSGPFCHTLYFCQMSQYSNYCPAEFNFHPGRLTDHPPPAPGHHHDKYR